MDERITAGETIANRYLLRKVVGKGGQASVWLALDLQTQAEIALKIASARVTDNPASLSRLAREAELLTRLDHPHIARCLDFAIDAERPYLVMEYIRGVSLSKELRKRVQTRTHFALGQIHEMFAQLLDAVGYAHGLSIAHRDLKPDNIMLVSSASEVSVKVLDLGVAKLLDQEAHAETTQGRVLGSVMYMAPEQAAGAAIDHRCDIFALGTILFEVLTSRRAWARDNRGTPWPAFVGAVPLNRQNAATEILGRILSPERPRPSQWRTDLPPSLDTVVARALAVARDERYSSAEAFLEALETALGTGEPRTQLTVLAPSSDGTDDFEPDPEISIAGDLLEREELERARLRIDGEASPFGGLTRTAPGGTIETRTGSGEGSDIQSAPSPPRRGPHRGLLALGATFVFALGLISALLIIGSQSQESEALPPADPPSLAGPVPRIQATVRAEREPVPPVEPSIPKDDAVGRDVPTPQTEAEAKPTKRSIAPPKRPVSARVDKTKVSERPRDPLSALSSQIATLRSDPANLALFNRTGQAIIEAASERVSSKAKRDRIQRLAAASMRVADLRQLERAFSELEASVE